MPPIWNADHNIVYAGCALSLKRNKKINRDTYQHKKTNWRSIRKDVNKHTQEIKGHYHNSSTNNLCNTFPDGLLRSVKKKSLRRQLQTRKTYPWLIAPYKL